MDDVKVLVRVFDRGRNREAVVDVPESAFLTRCWKTIASLMAAVALELPFTDVERLAKYGLRPEDKERLQERMRSGDPQNGDQ